MGKKMPKKQAEEIAMKNLERVQIADQAKKFPGQLSEGNNKGVPWLELYVWNRKLCYLMNQLLHLIRNDKRSIRCDW